MTTVPGALRQPSPETNVAASLPFCEHARPQENCFPCWKDKKGLWARAAGRQGVDSGSLKGASSGPGESQTSDTVFRRSPVQVKTGRARQSGRPRVSAAAQRQKALNRDRAYRARKRAEAEAHFVAESASLT